jgi:glycosyltransferase involved in cell wall biosynthesis
MKPVQHAIHDVAVVLVRNAVTHDARVLRAARTLQELGYRTTIVGVVSSTEEARVSAHGAIPIVRLRPRSVFTLLRRRPAPPAAARAVAPGKPGIARQGGRAYSRLLGLHRWSRTLDFYRRAFGALRSLRPALVHCNDYNTMWPGLLARVFLGTHVVYDLHELWADRNQRPEPRWLLLLTEALFVRVADATVTTSPGYAAVTSRRYRVREPVVVRNLPSHTEWPSRVRRATGPAQERPMSQPVATYVGGLIRHRGIEQSIAALGGLPDLRLRLVGPVSAAYHGELAALAAHVGVADRVDFIAPVAPAMVPDAIADADLGLCLIQPVCLSYRLTLPNKLFEYVAGRLPILVSDLPVMADLVRQHDLGCVVPPGDVGAIADGCRELLAPDRNRRCREAANALAAELHWEKERERLVQVYGQAANGRLPDAP